MSQAIYTEYCPVLLTECLPIYITHSNSPNLVFTAYTIVYVLSVYKIIVACMLVFSTRLVAGDVEGRFEQLFTRVGSILKKSGQFDVCSDHHIVYTAYNIVISIFHCRCYCVWVHSSVLEVTVRHNGRN